MREQQEAQVPSLGQEDPLEEDMATRSSILAWRIPCTEEPGGLQSMGSHKSWTRLKWLGTRSQRVRLRRIVKLGEENVGCCWVYMLIITQSSLVLFLQEIKSILQNIFFSATTWNHIYVCRINSGKFHISWFHCLFISASQDRTYILPWTKIMLL